MAKMMDVRPQAFCKQIRCDRCEREASAEDHEFHLFTSLEIDATWGSELGDGNHVEVDLCHSCIKDVLGPWLRVSVQGWAKASSDFLIDREQSPPQEREF